MFVKLKLSLHVINCIGQDWPGIRDTLLLSLLKTNTQIYCNLNALCSSINEIQFNSIQYSYHTDALQMWHI